MNVAVTSRSDHRQWIKQFIPSIGRPRRRSRPIGADDIRICDCARFPIGTEIAGAIYRQNLSEPASCTVNSALDGADCASTDLSGLLVGKPGCADQNQRFALFRGKQLERVAKLDDLKSAVLLRQRGEGLSIGAIDILNFAPTLAIFRAE